MEQLSKYETIGRIEAALAIDTAQTVGIGVKHFLTAATVTNMLAQVGAITPEVQAEVNKHFEVKVRIMTDGQKQTFEEIKTQLC